MAVVFVLLNRYLATKVKGRDLYKCYMLLYKYTNIFFMLLCPNTLCTVDVTCTL